ncbi:MAG: hypothetical protein AB8B52_04045 [Winogradskyella sp.]|uniref:hypothetical protein n=1 Tax=Winogradskyella sp. TaxID=1883156 RepID=UPI00385E2D5E
MNFKINNIDINTLELLELINSGKTLEAIKLIKAKTRIGLKECKNIVDNLIENPNFYDDKDYDSERDYIEDFGKPKKRQRNRGQHILENKSNTNNYLVIAVILVLIILVYFYLKTTH